MRSLFAAILRMYLKAIGQMPPCPLRDQLLERDEEIFTNEHFDNALRDIARAKFFSVKQSNPVSRGLACLRKTMSVCSVQSTTRISDTKTSNTTVGETVPSCKTSSFDPDNDDSVGPIPEPTVWKALGTGQPQTTQLETISVEHACGNGHQNQDAELSPRIRALPQIDELNPPTNLSPSSSSSEEKESGYFATPSSALRFHKWSSYMAVSPGAQSPSNILSMAQQGLLTSASLATLEDLPAVPSTPPAAEIPKLKSTNTMVSSNSGKSRWMKSTLLSSQILLRNKGTNESSHFSDGVQRRLIQKDVSSCVSAVDEVSNTLPPDDEKSTRARSSQKSKRDAMRLRTGHTHDQCRPGSVQPNGWIVPIWDDDPGPRSASQVDNIPITRDREVSRDELHYPATSSTSLESESVTCPACSSNGHLACEPENASYTACTAIDLEAKRASSSSAPTLREKSSPQMRV